MARPRIHSRNCGSSSSRVIVFGPFNFEREPVQMTRSITHMSPVACSCPVLVVIGDCPTRRHAREPTAFVAMFGKSEDFHHGRSYLMLPPHSLAWR